MMTSRPVIPVFAIAAILLATAFLLAPAGLRRAPALSPLPSPSPEKSAEHTGADDFNVVLIDVTCLRAGNLSCQGYSRKTSPFLDFAATKGIWFRHAFSQAYWTLPSVTSLFTSRYVPSHGVVSRGLKLSEGHVTLAQALKRAGYRTAAFVGGLDMDGVHNLGQGFDVYEDDTGNKPMGYLSENLPKAVDWLEENGRTRFFLFVQGYDLHPPFSYPAQYENMFDPAYAGPLDKVTLDYELLRGIERGRLVRGGRAQQLSPNDLAHVTAHYDGGLGYVNMLLRDFYLRLRSMGLLAKTIIVLVGDHGEELGDHGYFDRYGRASLYDEVVHVPFIIVHPTIRSVRIDQPVELVDVAPTILGLLGMQKEQGMEGENLFPLVLDEVPEDPHRCVYGGWGEKQMVRTAQWKLIFDRGKLELYRVGADPRERTDLVKKHPAVAASLARKLFHWLVSFSAESPSKKNELPLDQIPRFLRERELIRLAGERRINALERMRPGGR